MRNTIAAILLLCFTLNGLAVEVVVFPEPARCGLNNGSVYASVTGGLPPYSFSWSNGATTPSITDLAPGDYTVTVTDGLSNTAEATATVAALFQMGDPGMPIQIQPDCMGMCTGIALASPPYGGIQPYSYPPNVFDAGAGQLNIMGVCPDVYTTIDVIDVGGCPGSIILVPGTVAAVTPPVVTVQSSTPACEGQSNGTMTLLITSGAAGEVAVTHSGGQYSQTHYPALMVPYVVNGLPAGDYQIHSSIQGGPFGTFCFLDFTGSVPELPAPCGTISGLVFHDADQDCNFGGFDLPIPNKVMEIMPGPSYAISAWDGNYQRGLAFGNFTIGQTLNNETQVCPPANPAAFTLIAGAPQAIVDFANVSNMPHDLGVSVGSSAARPGFPTQVWVTVINGSPFPSGDVTIDLSFDPLLLNPSPASGQWNVGVIPPFGWETRTFQALVPADIDLLGTVLSYTVTASNTASEANTGNNTAADDMTITGSYDPNDKQGITSSGLSPTQYFLAQDDRIDYTVRFQNTGTDTAFTVVVRDEVDTDFDITSLEFLGASHAFTPSFGEGRELVFTFADINLPDSTTDLLGSQGFISFRLKPKNDIIVGDELENTAGIYFDFNPPIITNTVTHVVDFSTGQAQVQEQEHMRLLPNPANDVLNAFVTSWTLSIQVLTMDGRSIQVPGTPALDGFQLDVRALPAGLYFIKTDAGTARFVKQ
ncbi:MAG: T9SS type A sorting domain-containing protein [Flavobacteriales bacterium]|nr:T9SS type A sorting domain-containing protein [Flavobacteriales bacterium]